MDYFDLHADTLTMIPENGECLYSNSCDYDLERVSKFDGRVGQVFALWKNRQKITEADPADAFLPVYERAMKLLEAESDRASFCRSADEMENAWADGKVAAFLSIEDLSVMGSLAERVKEYGIRFVLLTWNYLNEYGSGAANDQTIGLSEKGRSFVQLADREGLILDVSHLSDQGVEDICEMTNRPIIASHSNIRAVANMARNLTDAHAAEIIRRKGLIGFNMFAPFVGETPTLDTIRRHLEAILELGGEDAIALGADFDGSDGMFPEGISGVQSMPAVREYLSRCGYSEKLLNKLFFENARGFIKRNLL